MEEGEEVEGEHGHTFCDMSTMPALSLEPRLVSGSFLLRYTVAGKACTLPFERLADVHEFVALHGLKGYTLEPTAHQPAMLPRDVQ